MGGYNFGDLGGRNCATVWFNLNGNVRRVACSSEAAPGLGYVKHSEKACFEDIRVYWSFEWPGASHFTNTNTNTNTKKRKTDEYARAVKREKHERAAGTKQCKIAGRAVLQPGPWGASYS